MESQCCSHLYFPNGKGCWTLLQIFASHLNFLFWGLFVRHYWLEFSLVLVFNFLLALCILDINPIWCVVPKDCFLFYRVALCSANCFLCYGEAFKFHVFPLIVILRIKNDALGYFLKYLALFFSRAFRARTSYIKDFDLFFYNFSVAWDIESWFHSFGFVSSFPQ